MRILSRCLRSYIQFNVLLGSVSCFAMSDSLTCFEHVSFVRVVAHHTQTKGDASLLSWWQMILQSSSFACGGESTTFSEGLKYKHQEMSKSRIKQSKQAWGKPTSGPSWSFGNMFLVLNTPGPSRGGIETLLKQAQRAARHLVRSALLLPLGWPVGSSPTIWTTHRIKTTHEIINHPK